MKVTNFVQQVQFHLLVHGQQYKFYIEAAAVAVLVYVGVSDFRIYKIRNDVLLLLLVLYVLLAIVDRSQFEVLTNIILAVLLFAVLVWFYARGGIGGGDVKLLTVAALWVGSHCALLFSALLLLFVGTHVFAAWMGWAETKAISHRLAIPYAPSVAAALIGVILLGCL